MKKNILLILASILILLLSSCNADSTEGLFQLSANSKREEEHTVINILGKDENNLYVSTYDGISYYDFSSNKLNNSFRGNGNEAASALFADKDSYIFYNSNNKIVDNNGNEVENLVGFSYQPMFTRDGEHFTYVFQKDGDFYKSTAISAYPTSFNTSTTGEINSVKIIGDNAYFIRATNGRFLCVGDDQYTAVEEDTATYINGLYITNSGKLSDSTKSIDGDSSYAVFDNGSKVYIIPNGDISNNNIYEVDSSNHENVETRSISSLSNVKIISILSAEGNTLTALTAKNGIVSIDLSNSTVTQF